MQLLQGAEILRGAGNIFIFHMFLHPSLSHDD